MIWQATKPRLTPSRQLGVAHVSFSLRTGGMERLLVEYARHADRDRFRLQFYCLTDRGTPADDIEACGWTVHELAKRGGFRWGVVRRLARAFRAHGIQVVHTHNSGAMIYGALAAKLSGARAVVHTRHGQRFGAGRGQTWRFAHVSRLVDRVVGVSRDVSAQSVSEGIPPTRVRTVLNGIDLTQFTYSGGSPDGPAVLVARLVPEKDLPTLLRAAAVVVRQDRSFRLQLVGDGPCMPEAREMIHCLRLEPYVDLLGERRDVPAILRRASMFVMSSRTEGISLTLLEAMAAGLPVVATDVGGNSEVVSDGETGWLVPQGDPERLAQAILTARRDRGNARRFGRAGRQRVEQCFDVVQMVRQYEQMYREVLSERRNGRGRLEELTKC